MADLGWAGMAGTAGAGDAIAQLFKQRMEQAQLTQQNDQFNRQMDQQDALVRLRYAEQAAATRERAQARADALEERKQQNAQANELRMLTGLVPMLSPGQSIDDSTATALKSSPFTASLVRSNAPAAGGQFMASDQQPDYVPGQQPGQTFAGTAQQVAQQRNAQRLENEAAAREREASMKLEDGPLVMLADGTMVPRSQAVGKKGYIKATPEQTITIQTVDDQGRPVTKVLPKSEAIGQTFEKGPGAVVANRLASATAVQQTGNDIINELSSPDVKAMLGPSMGRYNTLREFIGNPPPEFANLAGQIESYALANMGVHGMRSTQGAEQIKHLLDQRHTPESLAATIRGLNGFSQHFIENETKKPAAKGGASADDLIKKYGGR